ncbi:MAG: CBS domain-containing protein [Acidobacteria bacterium]|nr:CBS domain-containing protein [Acidobacteriota bacterium]NIM60382.1 CBS domain-containing protein [Acidobacteriota bacterium]NIO60317.1 CBS domain-containing protein [Acidobacteriota bacterium]NIQ31372.1 CBS domain-containing protein [Acidobacteriota bacterium]NIQ86595.1 CBS domain-containing protein [Acidobacteriota bacterium]
MNTLRDLMTDNRVLDLGPLPAPRLAPNATLHQALQFLVRGRRGAIVAVDGMRPVGIFTERDVLRRLPAGKRDTTPLSEVMSKPPATIRRKASLREAIEAMVEHGYRHLVVVDRDGELKGLLTSNDLVQYLTDQFPEETVNLPPRLRQQYLSPEGA